MKINCATENALRVLLFAASHPTRLVKIREVAEAYGLTENPLMKTVHTLQKHDYIETQRGRNGGFRLAKSPENININEISSLFENMIYLENKEEINGDDFLIQRVFARAQLLFSNYLESVTLQDLLDKRLRIQKD